MKGTVIIREPCGCVTCVFAEYLLSREDESELRDEVIESIQRGCSIEHFTAEEVRAMKLFCDCEKT
jgi:hypothetical protein